MPSYDYRCTINGRVVEVKHRISDKLKTWGEVCTQAGIEMGDTPADTPVERLITGGQFVSSSSLKNPEPACSTGGCCPTGYCGLN
jgi:hypothetical protein